MKKIAILQSNYIPWKGYFDLIAYVDEFIIYDDVQFTRRDWRNRNKIKTPSGLKWISLPVKTKGKYNQLINETEIDGADWLFKHRELLIQNYKNAPFFKEYWNILRPIYESEANLLSDLNMKLITKICNLLGIGTKISQSTCYSPVGTKTDRLLSICKNCNADIYVSGPSAQAYLEIHKFDELGKQVEWFDYSGYQKYPQLWDGFEHNVTILDLLFNCGPEASNYMRYVK